jgi:hypothetical protein
MEALSQLLVVALVCFLTYEISNFLQARLLPPIAKDPESLRKRIERLARRAPRLAILDGWSMVSDAVLMRARSSLGADFDPSKEIVEIANELPGMTPSQIERIERLKTVRNLVAHSREAIPEGELTTAIADLFPLLLELGPDYSRSGASC